MHDNRHDGMRMMALCVAAAVAVVANAKDAGELFKGSQWIGQPKELNAAAAKFGGNEIRLYTQPLRYEVLKDGVVVVPPTQIDVQIDGALLVQPHKAQNARVRGDDAGVCECGAARDRREKGLLSPVRLYR